MGVGPLLGIRGTLNQSLWQFQLRPQQALAARHLPLVNLVIVPGQMQQTVQNQHLDLG
jgi:hypothetical protein